MSVHSYSILRISPCLNIKTKPVYPSTNLQIYMYTCRRVDVYTRLHVYKSTRLLSKYNLITKRISYKPQFNSVLKYFTNPPEVYESTSRRVYKSTYLQIYPSTCRWVYKSTISPKIAYTLIK